MTPCRLVEIYRSSGETFCLHFEGKTMRVIFYPEYGGSRFLQNIGILIYAENGSSIFFRNAGAVLPDYMVSCSSRL
jgi:hypothetical protein